MNHFRLRIIKNFLLVAILVISGVFACAKNDVLAAGLTVGTSSAPLEAPHQNLIYGITSQTTATGSFMLFQRGSGNDLFRVDWQGDMYLSPGKSIKLNSASTNTTLYLGNFLNSAGVGESFVWGAPGSSRSASLVVEGDVKGNALCIQDDCKSTWGGIGATSGWTVSGNNVYKNPTDGSVGIGTTAPGSKLQVETSVAGPIATFKNTSNNYGGLILRMDNSGQANSRNWGIFTDAGAFGNLSFAPSTNSTSTPIWSDAKITFNKDGNVGIGTTNPISKLSIQDLGRTELLIDGNTSGVSDSYVSALVLRSNTDYRGRGILMNVRDTVAEWYAGVPYEGGGYQIAYDPTGGLGEYKTNAKLYINTTGNVGIGTTNPANKLSVSYTDTNYGMAAQFVNTATTGNVYNGLRFTQGTTESFNLLTTNSSTILRGITNIPMMFYTNNTERLRIKEDGNVGIGTVAPTGKLGIHASPSTGVETNSIAFDSGASELGSIRSYNAGSYYQDMRFYVSNGTSTPSLFNALTIKGQTGNIGIGTTNPGAKLDVNGVGSFSSVIATGGTFGILAGGGTRLVATDNSGNIYATSTSSILPPGTITLPTGINGQTLRYGSSAWEATSSLFVKNDGNVGIGTTNPTNKLDIRLSDITQGAVNIYNYQGGTYGAYNMLNMGTDSFTNANRGLRVQSFTPNGGPFWMYLLYNGYASGTTPDFYQGSYERFSGIEFAGGNMNFLVNTGAGGAGANTIITPTKALSIMYTGNVGIGTTNPGTKLQISGGSVEGSHMGRFKGWTGGGESGLGFEIGVSGGTGYAYVYDRTLNSYGTMAIQNVIHTSGSNGYVGIGTTTPGAKLDINGSLRVLYPYSVTFGGLGGSGNRILMTNNSGDIYATSSSIATGLPVGTDGQTLRNSSGAWVANSVLYNNGTNIGINNTSPQYNLQIGTTATGTLAIANGGGGPLIISGSATDGIARINNSNSGVGAIQFQSRGNDTVRIDNGGNVGIGTIAPQKKLDALSSANDFVTVGAVSLGAGQWTGIHFGYRENNLNYRKSAIVFERTDNGGGGGNAAGKIHILNGPAVGGGSATLADARLTIGELGHVGIGVVNPLAKLVVGGDYNNTGAGGIMLDAYPAVADVYSLRINPFVVGSGKVGYQFQTKSVTGGTQIPLTFDNAGYVGIGTTTPGYKLDVYGSPRFNNWAFGLTPGASQLNALATVEYVNAIGNLWSGTKNGNIWNGDAGAGNVGIGTTGPNQDLHVRGSDGSTFIKVSDSQSNVGDLVGLLFGTQATDTYPKTMIAHTEGGSTDGAYGRGDLIFALNNDGDNTPVSVSDEVMRITNTGNVGIGTTSPGYKLDVNLGNVSSNINIGYNVFANAGGTIGYAGYNLQLDNSTANASGYLRLARTSGTAFLGMEMASQSRDGIRFLTHATAPVEAMRINAAGNVGIGTTNPGTSKLSVEVNNSSTNFDTSVYPLKLRNTAWLGNQVTGIEFWNGVQKVVPTARIISQMNGSGSGGENLHFQTQTSSATNPNPNQPTTKLSILADGNVGIGTSNPGAKLDVIGSGRIDGLLTVGSTAQSASMQLVDSNGSTWQLGSGIVGNHYFNIRNNTNGSLNALVIDYSGNVGISTTSPVTRLSIYNNGGSGNKTVYLDRGSIYGLDLTPVDDDQAVPLGYLKNNYTPLWSGTKNGNIWNGSAGAGNVGIGTTNPQAKLQVAGGMILNRTAVTTSTYTASSTDYIIAFPSLATTGNATTTLPNALCTPGRVFLIVNESAVNTVIIDPEGGTLISGYLTINLPAYNSTPVYCGVNAWYMY